MRICRGAVLSYDPLWIQWNRRKGV